MSERVTYKGYWISRASASPELWHVRVVGTMQVLHWCHDQFEARAWVDSQRNVKRKHDGE